MRKWWLILTASVVVAPIPARAVTFQEVIEGYKQLKTPLLYTECSKADGKALLIVSVNPGEIWLVETKDRWVVNSARVKIEDNQVVLVDALGGLYSYLRATKLVEELVRNPFEFLMPDSLDFILRSRPRAACLPPPTP